MKRSFYARVGPWILVGAAALVPVLYFGARGAIRGVDNDVRNWLPSRFEETRVYDWFLEQFGTEEMVVLSWPGATLEDPRLTRMAEALSPYTGEPHETTRADVTPPYFREVRTGPGLLEELTGPPLNLPREEALSRLEGALIGPDHNTSALMVVLSPVGTENRPEVLALLQREAADVGVPADQARMGGPTVDSVALDVESERARYLLSLISVLVACLLAWLCLRRIQLVLIVFASALLSAGAAVTVMHFAGGTLDLVMVMMPVLVYVLAISSSVHLVNYYQDIVARHGIETAAERTTRLGWVPATLSAVTTAIGLGSLSISEVLPVRNFGIFASIGVLCILPVVLLVLPSALQLWPLRRPHREPLVATTPFSHDRLAHWSDRPVQIIMRHHRGALAAVVGLMVLMGLGAARLESSVRLLNLFSPEARIIQDYAWLEERLGPLVPIELVIEVEQNAGARLVDQIELVRSIEERLEALPAVGGSLSAATFAPEFPESAGWQNIARQRIMEERLQRNADRFVEANYLRETSEGLLWRVSARVRALEDIDYGEFIQHLDAEIAPLVDAWGTAHDVRATTTFTGMVPLVYRAQRTLLSDLVSSFVMAFALVALLMTSLLRSARAGLLLMLPNIFPAVIVFGVLGWGGVPISIGSMMTASLALGIAVDDTIHLLNWFRTGTRQGYSRPESTRAAFEHCAGAMLQTSIITGFGVLVFTLSGFQPTSRFALLLCVLLFLALLGDLLLLPALLNGRWGRFFAKPPRPRSEHSVFSREWLRERRQRLLPRRRRRSMSA